MHVHADRAQRRMRGHAPVHLVRLVREHPELGGRVPRAGKLVRGAVHIGVDAHRNRCHRAHFGGEAAQRLQFLGAFDVKGHDPCLDPVPHLVERLAHAGEDDAVGRDARAQGAVQFAAADDVGSGTGPRQEFEHGQVGVGLDRVCDERARRHGRVRAGPGASGGHGARAGAA